MKPNLRTRVAGFVVCFALTAGISSSNAQMPGNSPLPPADINTSDNGKLMPPIVSASNANEQSSRSQVPIVQSNQSLAPRKSTLAPIVQGANASLTPKIASEVPEFGDGEIKPASGEQLNEGYSIQSAGQVIMGPTTYAAPQQLAPRQAMPPIVSGGNQSISNNPLGQPMRAQPSYLQTASPSSMLFPQDQEHSVLPMESAPSANAPSANGPMAAGSQVRGSIDLTSPRSVIDSMPMTNSLLQAPMSQPCNGCASGCSSCGNIVSPTTSIGRSFIGSASSTPNPVIGCNSCGNAGCTSCVGSSTSACSSCGTNGCYNTSEVDKRFAACGFISRARSYFILDVLYMTRANGEVNGINLSPISEFDYGFGARFTAGRRTDAANGREFSYFGSFGVEDGGNVADAAGRIRRRFIPDGTFITDADLSAFSNVTSASERIETSFHSFEYNRVRWGWDVVKVLFGARYVNFEDDYDLTTNNIFGETGSLSVDAKNHMIGPQVGLEMFYDVGFRWSLSGFGKFGLMLNAYDADVNASTNGFGLSNSGTSEADMGFLVDLGLTAHYQLTSRSRFRIGYNLLFLGDVTTADEAFPTFLSPFSSNSLDADDDALFTGLSLGLEFYR